jgi:hypothetical protein
MKKKINEEVICLIRKDEGNQIVIGYMDIINPFKTSVDELAELCEWPTSTIDEILSYIQTTKDFELLTSYYNYCVSLTNSFEGFFANNQNFIKEIKDRYQIILFKKMENPDTYNIENAIKGLKFEIKNKYILWSRAFAIKNTYRLCHEDKSIIVFSHRMVGWSNPVYQLTPDFSIEIKTNFGYGRVSYFYTKLKFKNIDITPFSEWVDYEFASYSDIIRYTQSHPLMNEYWEEAMDFSLDACNLSLIDEVKFVEKYIIDECEKMVSGLEELFNKEVFTFRTRYKREYSVDKKGHVLVGFRGEKISGALDFISKILEFDNITKVKSFIRRIEECNKRIQPILLEEAKILKIKIESLTKERDELQPKYDEILKISNEYNSKRNKLYNEMISKGELNSNWNNTLKLENAFVIEFPDYTKFKEEYKRVSENYGILIQKIQSNTKFRDNIVSYNDKILRYFGK